jgi:hypothetical protein
MPWGLFDMRIIKTILVAIMAFFMPCAFDGDGKEKNESE